MTDRDSKMADDRANDDERRLLELLKDYPMPEAEAGFYDQALARAAAEGRRRERRRWTLTGFGVAAAAAVLIALTSGVFFGNDLPAGADIPGVTVALAEPRTVRLVFSSDEALNDATLTVSLPAGVELEGFPGQREISWQTSLAPGRNLLPLTLIAVTPAAGGELLARLEHDDRDRTFKLRVDIG